MVVVPVKVPVAVSCAGGARLGERSNGCYWFHMPGSAVVVEGFGIALEIQEVGEIGIQVVAYL